jgi:hypothetical protein
VAKLHFRGLFRFARTAAVKAKRSSTRKQVVIRKLDKGLVKGFVDPASYLRPEGVEVLDRSGRLVHIPLHEVKGVFFVRDFDGNPQRAERKIFRSRPRVAGLWVRMTFKDKEVLEGLLANDLLAIDPLGFFLTPPDFYSNNLRMFIPRGALSGIEVLGVVSDGAVQRAWRRSEASQPNAPDYARQIGLFSPISTELSK